MKRLYFVMTAVMFAAMFAFVGCSSSGDDVDGDIVVDKDDNDDDLLTEFPVADVISSIPTPPAGQRWIVNELFTDEFNGTEIDDSKWYDYHPTWDGRAPGLFKPENISFEDGCMVLRGETMDEPEYVWNWNNTVQTKYTISCAAVVSKTQAASYGYYECRFKANQTTLSSTFWMSTRKNYDTAGKQPSSVANGIFQQELDICECIGRGGDFSGSAFADGMNSNVHFWYTESGKDQIDVRVPSTLLKIEDGSKPADGFNTYGCWWRDDSSASFYLNNEQDTHRDFMGHNNANWSDPYDVEFKFTEGMGVNMVVETYPYPWIDLPNETELADAAKNRTYYDWVRAYVLVDYDKATASGTSEMTMFEDLVNVSYTNSNSGVNFQIHYTAPVDRKLKVALYDKSGVSLSSAEIDAPAGYSNIEYKFSYPSVVTLNSTYYVVAYFGEVDSSDLSKDYLSADSFDFKF